MYARFCELNREHGNHGFLMGGAQAGPLQKIFSEAITEFTEKGTDGKITRSQRGDITADVADILLQTHATVQWSVVKKKLWKVAEEHYGYHLRISDLARTAMDSGVGLENAHRIFLKNIRGNQALKLREEDVKIDAAVELNALCRNIYVTFDATHCQLVRERQHRMQKTLSFSRECFAPVDFEAEVPVPSQ